MKTQYFNLRTEVLLCRRRVTDDWQPARSLKDSFWRFYWHPGKTAQIISGGKSFAINSEMFALIPPETEFNSVMQYPVEQFYVHFICSYPYDRVSPGIYTFNLFPAMSILLNMISTLLKKEEALPSRKLSFLVSSLCAMSLGSLADLKIFPPDHDECIREIINYTDANFSSNISNAQLAKKAGMARNSFIRLFHGETGISPQQYLRERRIREACVMLRHSSDTIDDIASHCGFSDRCHFSRVFKRLRNISPAAFRRTGSDESYIN